MKKDDAVAMLLRLFDDNKLSFRDMATLKSVFDEAVEACNDARNANLAEYEMGRAGLPDVFDRDTEDEFFSTIEVEAEQKLAEHGVRASGKALEAIVDFAYEQARYTSADFYYNR